MPKSVLLAESYAYLLEVLSGLLSASGYTVVGETTRQSEVAELARALKPDLIVYDFCLSSDGMAGLSELNTLKAERPEIKILVIGFQDATDEYVAAIIKSGCDAFWNKFESQAGLMKTLKGLLP